MKEVTALVLTVSDRAAAGVREDRAGPVAVRALEDLGIRVAGRSVVPDDREEISRQLREAAAAGVDLVITTGGTGLGPRDVTPEATKAVIQREAPGIAEALRSGCAAGNPRAWLSRGVCGILDRTLIINLPGSPRAVAECMAILSGLLGHAVEVMRGEVRDCAHLPPSPEQEGAEGRENA